MRSLATRMKKQLFASRIALVSLTLPLMLASGGMMETVQPVLRFVYIVLGFSLIIFLHELGHFAVARMCSVKCLAFSIGIGPRMCGWRKGGGFSFGNDPYDPETLKEAERLRRLNAATPEPAPAEQPEPHKHHASSVQSDLQTTAYVPPHPKSVGDCDYRVSWAPLGGYVRMLGQDDMDPTKVSTDPHAFNQRPIWQRMCIVSAGVIMNLIFAAVCFSIIFSPGIGVDFPPARVGSVTYGMPAWGQLHRGDRILSINGEKPRGFVEFTDVMMAAALAKSGEEFDLEVERYQTKDIEHVKLVPTRSNATGFLAFGIESMPGLKIGGKGTEYTDANAEKAFGNQVTFELNKPELNKLTEEGYKIVGVDGIDLHDAPEPNATHDRFVLLYNHINEKNGQPILLTVENAAGVKKEINLHPHIEYVPGDSKFPAVFGIGPQALISEPGAKSPAALAGLKAGDRLTLVGDRSYPDMEEIRKIISTSEGRPLAFRIERAAAAATAPATTAAATVPVIEPASTTLNFTIAAKKVKGGYQIGIPLYQDLKTTRFIAISPDSEVARLDLGPDASITAVDSVAVHNWQEIYAQLRTKNAGSQVVLTFQTDRSAQPVQHAFTMTKEEVELVKDRLHFMIGLSLANETKTQVASDSGNAVLMGMDHTKKFILNVYMTLHSLVTGTVDPSNLHGIVGITKIGYDVQERGHVWLWYVLAMVSVNLAVANFLPLPIVDGGLFLLLILEKIRGKPLSLKIQTAIQTVGIVLLAGMFIFVTYNDITGLILK